MTRAPERPATPPPEGEAPPASARDVLRPSAWSSTFASLREREFAWFFAGNISFFMAMQMQFILRAYLAFDLTDSASALGVISATIALPMLVAAPIGGVVADRFNRRTLLIITQSAAAAASLVIAVLILADLIEFWHLVAVSLSTALVFSFNMPARQAIVPQLVPQQLLMNAISLQMGSMNLTRIAAPAVAGMLIGPLGAGTVYLLTFVLFCVATASEFRLPRHGMKPRGSGQSFVRDLGGGFGYIRAHSVLGLLIAASLVVPLFGFPVQQLLVVFSERVFDRGAGGYGVLASVTGIGGLIGAIISANMDRRPAKGRMMILAGVLMAIFLVAFALAPTFELALLFLAIANIGQMLFTATNNTVIMGTVPEEVRGRVMSVMMMSFGLMPLGVVPLTVLTDVYGARATVAASSALLLVAVVAIFGLSPRLRGLRLEPPADVELSPARAASMVASGEITQEEADRRSGRSPARGVATPPRS